LPWVGETGWCGTARGKWFSLNKADRKKENNDEEDLEF